MTAWYQNIILVLSDGREIIATVPEFVSESDEVKVVDIKVTESKELPPDYKFEEISE